MAPKVGHVFKSVATRLAERSIPEPNSGCWLWIGANNGLGYGMISVGKAKKTYAHRCAYEHAFGEIPSGLVIDHKCRTPSCINPEHLEAVSNRENTVRGAVSALRTISHVCKRGHAYAEHQYVDSRGQRQCRACLALRQLRYRAKEQ